MQREEILNIAKEFLHLIENGEENPSDNVKSLWLILDKLALAIHFVEFDFDESEYPSPPKHDSNKLRARISVSFPSFGNYNSVAKHVSDIAESEIVIEDAIDDILDIAQELEDVIWYWHNTSVEDALWNFKNGFENHWGLHLRNLQLYLYAISQNL